MRGRSLAAGEGRGQGGGGGRPGLERHQAPPAGAPDFPAPAPAPRVPVPSRSQPDATAALPPPPSARIPATASLGGKQVGRRCRASDGVALAGRLRLRARGCPGLSFPAGGGRLGHLGDWPQGTGGRGLRGESPDRAGQGHTRPKGRGELSFRMTTATRERDVTLGSGKHSTWLA